jgi:signal peptidase I
MREAFQYVGSFGWRSGIKRVPAGADQRNMEVSSLPLGRPVRRRIARRALPVAVLALAGLWLALHKDVQYYKVTSGSMEPTLQIGQRVAAQRSHAPQVGDIVLFHPPAGARPRDPVCGSTDEGTGTTAPCGIPLPQESNSTFIKRVVAGSGDMVAIVDGHAVVNGVTESDPYIEPCTGGEDTCNFPTPVRVPAGDYYMLGDDRGTSDDSRFWGPVPGAWIIGTVVRCSDLRTVCHAVH